MGLKSHMFFFIWGYHLQSCSGMVCWLVFSVSCQTATKDGAEKAEPGAAVFVNMRDRCILSYIPHKYKQYFICRFSPFPLVGGQNKGSGPGPFSGAAGGQSRAFRLSSPSAAGPSGPA